MSIDRKFKIHARSVASGNTHSEDDAVLFLAKDTAFLMTLPTYLDNCKKVGAGPDQIKAVELMIDRVKDYRAAHPHLVKVPDVDPLTEPGCLQK